MIQYRVLFDKKAVDLTVLDKIDTVVVTQDLETASEALLTIPICADDTGSWKKDPLIPSSTYQEVRIEVSFDGTTWTALIDGLIIGNNVTISGDPGKSAFVMVAQDDSFYLNRNETIITFPISDPTPDKIIRHSFETYATKRPVDYVFDPTTEKSVGVDYTHRGKVMPLLHEMAKRHRHLLYLQPDPEVPGRNVVHWRAVSETSFTKQIAKASLTVLGKDRNVETFEVKINRDTPDQVSSAALSLSNKATLTSSTRVALPESPDEKPIDPPGADQVPALDDPEMAKAAAAWEKSFVYEASGALVGGCFDKVLRPGDYVSVSAGDQAASGAYLVKGVVHTLNRFSYIQEFHLKRRAIDGAAPSASNPLAGII